MNSKKINQLILNPKSREFLDAYLKQPTHTLLLTGMKGMGLTTVAKVLAHEIAGMDVVIIEPTLHAQQKTANINVSDVKSIQKVLQNKRRAPLVVIMDEADKMTATTPETLLKLLEEPVENVYFILITHNMFNIPSTIISRSQIIHFLPADCNELTEKIKPVTKKSQIEFMAKGLPAETVRLLEDEEYFRTKARLFEDVKKFINSTTYERLISVSKLKDRLQVVDFINTLSKVTTLMVAKTGKVESLKLLSDVLERVVKNGNIKAQLTYLAINY